MKLTFFISEIQALKESGPRQAIAILPHYILENINVKVKKRALLILRRAALISNQIIEIVTLWWLISWPTAPLGKLFNCANAQG